MTYGWWIDPAGEVIEVEHLCGHSELVDYRDAEFEGWIAIVDQEPPYTSDWYGVKFSDVTVTVPALKKLLYMIVKTKKRNFEILDIRERYHHLEGTDSSKMAAIAFIGAMIKKKTLPVKKAPFPKVSNSTG